MISNKANQSCDVKSAVYTEYVNVYIFKSLYHQPSKSRVTPLFLVKSSKKTYVIINLQNDHIVKEGKKGKTIGGSMSSKQVPLLLSCLSTT